MAARKLGGLSAAWQAVRRAVLGKRIARSLGAAGVRHRQHCNSDDADLEQIFTHDLLDPGDVLVDVGCGAGRVIDFWLEMGVESEIFGLEIDERLATASRRRFGQHANVSIITGDAVANLPPGGTVFYLFDPFDDATLSRFADAVYRLASDANRGVMIYYLACTHVAVFERDSRFTVALERLESADSGSTQQLATVTIRPPLERTSTIT